MSSSTGRNERTYTSSDGRKKTISIWTGEDDEAFASLSDDGTEYTPTSSPSVDSRLALAGLIDSEIARAKEKFLNKHLDDLENTLEVPLAPQTSPLINQMKLSNDLKHQKETREILLAKVDTEYKKTDIQIKLRELQLKESANSTQEAMLIMQGNFYLQNEKMIAGFERINLMLGEVKSVISGLNEKLSSVKSHYDFLKNGSETLKDSNGNQIIPQEVQAKINAEKLIEQEDTNKTTFDDIKDFVGEALGTVEDSLENALGNTDGFSLDFNPLSYIDEILMTDFIENKDNYYPDK